MKCWNSAFNAQGSRVLIVVVHVGAVENICCSGKRKDSMKLTSPPKWVEKLVWVPVILLRKIPIPSYGFVCPVTPKLAVLTPLIVRLCG
jgi:hypothetical protein